jgi:hypothetical protein
MIRLSPPYGIWTIWKELFVIPKLTFLAVFVLCIYSLWTTVATVMRLRDLAEASHEVEIASVKNALAALNKRCTKLQQFNGALFYVFGFILFLSLQWAYMTIGTSTAPVAWLIMDNLLVVFAFGANVFFLFAVIHLTLWFATGRVNARASKLSAHKT